MPDELPPKSDTESVAEVLGRTAGRLFKTARPWIQDAAKAARPHIENAVQYAREHEDEIKDIATGLVKSRVPLPLRSAVDAVSSKTAPSQPKPAGATCPKCGQSNPVASKFCNECGAPMTT